MSDKKETLRLTETQHKADRNVAYTAQANGHDVEVYDESGKLKVRFCANIHDDLDEIMYHDLCDEFTVHVLREDIGISIPLCGLCGNSGIVNTLTTAKWNDKLVGVCQYCICPNGRKRKQVGR